MTSAEENRLRSPGSNSGAIIDQNDIIILYDSQILADEIASILSSAYSLVWRQIVSKADLLEPLTARTVVLLDCGQLPMTVAEILNLLEQSSAIPTIVVDRQPSISRAVTTIKAGAADYLPASESYRLPNILEPSLKLTELQKLERLSDSDRQLQKLITQNADGIIVVDRRGIVRFVNEAALALLGRQAAELVGDCLGFPVVGEDYLEVDIPSRQDGTIRVAQMRVSEIQWQETTAYLVSLRDITKLKRIEAERAELLETAQAANRAKDEFLAVLSHELRTPLNPIVGWAQVLKQGNVPQALVSRGIEVIHRNAMLQAQLIGDILDISRIISGKLKMQTAIVNLSEIVTEALETVCLSARAKSIEIVTHLEPVPPVQGDPMRLQQIVWNLLSNSIKFTPRQGKVTISLKSVADEAQIQVTDTGKGIEPEFLPYIFEYFRQAESSRNRSTGGLGLGLAIANYLAELHGGTLTAYSEGKDRGATFTLSIPTTEESK